MGKTKLKDILRIELNKDEAYGKVTEIMIWSPVHHSWLYERDLLTMGHKSRQYKFLMNQQVMKMGLRNDNLKYIAIFLKDYDKEKKIKIRKKIRLIY